jgi:hypothetical protein
MKIEIYAGTVAFSAGVTTAISKKDKAIFELRRLTLCLASVRHEIHIILTRTTEI